MSNSPIYRLTLTSTPRDDVPPEQRLRRLLKMLLRGYGFRATKVEQLPVEGEKQVANKRSSQS
jgi:hypothetical protein